MTKFSVPVPRDAHILLVEDNTTNQEIVLGLLEGSGIRVTIVSDGQQAVARFREDDDFDLVFMDLQMPVMDGYEATRQIRQINDEVPIIALTAETEPEMLRHTRAVGMNGHLHKPIDAEAFDAMLLQYVSRDPNSGIPEDKAANGSTAFSLPRFRHIDTAAGLKRVLYNEKIYITILKGLYQFKSVDLETITDSDSFQWTVHTITGLSGSAGAHALYRVARMLHTSRDRTLIPDFQRELDRVMDELDGHCLFEETDRRYPISRPEMAPGHKQELFARLREACATRRLQNVKPIFEEIDRFTLPFEDEIVYNEVKSLVRQFKFKRAWGVLGATEENNPDH